MSKEEIYIYCKGDFEKFKIFLADTDWSVIVNKININESWDNIV